MRPAEVLGARRLSLRTQSLRLGDSINGRPDFAPRRSDSFTMTDLHANSSTEAHATRHPRRSKDRELATLVAVPRKPCALMLWLPPWRTGCQSAPASG